jgi:hypothetical protein
MCLGGAPRGKAVARPGRGGCSPSGVRRPGRVATVLPVGRLSRPTGGGRAGLYTRPILVAAGPGVVPKPQIIPGCPPDGGIRPCMFSIGSTYFASAEALILSRGFSPHFLIRIPFCNAL